MKPLNRLYWGAAFAALAAVPAGAVLADEPSHEHPAAAAPADPEHGGPSGAVGSERGTGMMDMPMMKQHMQRMMEGMKKIHAAKPGAERERLMEEQMQLMTEHMDMMTRMMEMGGGKGPMMQGGAAPK